jgi:hypothetical protein
MSTVDVRSASFPGFLKIKIASPAAYTEGALSNLLSSLLICNVSIVLHIPVCFVLVFLFSLNQV